jgi:hypothetical protein
METIFLKGISYLVSVLMDPDANRQPDGADRSAMGL